MTSLRVLFFASILFAPISVFLYIPTQEVDKFVDFQYYEIQSSSLDEIRDEIRRKGPSGFAARTDWFVSWNWRCAVKLRTTFILPKLLDSEALSEVEQARWERFLKRVMFHERGHQHHGMQASKNVKNSRCISAKKIVAEYAEQDRRYDLLTGHGRTQGAYLP